MKPNVMHTMRRRVSIVGRVLFIASSSASAAVGVYSAFVTSACAVVTTVFVEFGAFGALIFWEI